MMCACIVAFCHNKATYRLPTDEKRRQQWINAIKYVRHGVTIRKHSRICSEHFIPTDYVRNPVFLTKFERIGNRLKQTAVPSIFPWKPAIPEKPPCQDLPNFDFTRVQKTYARTPRIAFVEEQPLWDIAPISDVNEDPLKCSNEDK